MNLLPLNWHILSNSLSAHLYHRLTCQLKAKTYKLKRMLVFVSMRPVKCFIISRELYTVLLCWKESSDLPYCPTNFKARKKYLNTIIEICLHFKTSFFFIDINIFMYGNCILTKGQYCGKENCLTGILSDFDIENTKILKTFSIQNKHFCLMNNLKCSKT